MRLVITTHTDYTHTESLTRISHLRRINVLTCTVYNFGTNAGFYGGLNSAAPQKTFFAEKLCYIQMKIMKIMIMILSRPLQIKVFYKFICAIKFVEKNELAT